MKLKAPNPPPPHDYERCPKCENKRFPCAECTARRQAQLIAASRTALTELHGHLSDMERQYGQQK